MRMRAVGTTPPRSAGPPWGAGPFASSTVLEVARRLQLAEHLAAMASVRARTLGELAAGV